MIMDMKLSQIFPSHIQLIFEQLGTIAVLNAEGQYVYVSRAWAQKMECAPECALGRHVTEFFPNTRALEAMEQGTPILAHPIKIGRGSEGKQFTSYFPLFEGDQLIGCIIQTIFHGINEAQDFFDSFNKLRNERNYYRRELNRIRGAKYSIDNIVGESRAISQLRHNIRQAARSVSTVLIEGETGSGKELVCHAIHALSNRSSGPFITVNCAAIPLELAESELFGYESGAFTGAKAGGKAGRFELAHRGTLFLDEIDQLLPVMQPKLLRVLQEKELERVGGTKSTPVDVRLIAATNSNLEEQIRNKQFRSDLYYRLNVISIRIPPLRERLEDLPLLVDDIVQRLNEQLGASVEGVSEDVLARFADYEWRGNIRELQNVLERAVNNMPTGLLTWDVFADYFKSREQPPLHNSVSEQSDFRAVKKRLEHSVVADALARSGGNKKQAAAFLGISRTMLYRKLHTHGLL